MTQRKRAFPTLGEIKCRKTIKWFTVGQKIRRPFKSLQNIKWTQSGPISIPLLVRKKSFYHSTNTVVVFKNTRGVTLCLHTHRLIVNRFQAMRRPTGFTMGNSYVALDVDMWCPDVLVVVCVWLGCSCWGVCLCKSIRIWASISMGGLNLKSWMASSIPGWSHTFVEIDHELIFYSHSPSLRWFIQYGRLSYAHKVLTAFSSLPRKSVVLLAEHFIKVPRYRLYKTESAVFLILKVLSISEGSVYQYYLFSPANSW